ncbi:MAG: YbhB/YbcL family Raf kinase inhibitor-like protein [Verrucomicrobia bacterium]|nr:YbhB/YbcL family Raf kinase inhibitor-like protein [Verrucomicrobiota bacterium]
MAFILESPGFTDGGAIPASYTCQGSDQSPLLRWKNSPAGTKSFALIVDDPDAPVGIWVHWVLYDIPASASAINQGVPPQEILPDGSKQGVNDFGKIGYGGPCPPKGKPHRYFFKLYALDNQPALKPRATKKELEQAMEGHILSTAELMGTYQRS